MNRYERERPGTGGAQAAICYAINTGRLKSPWATFWWMSYLRGEMYRAQLGVDGPNAWCGRNARLKRIIDYVRTLPGPRLP